MREQPIIKYEKDGIRIEVDSDTETLTFRKNGLTIAVPMDTLNDLLKELHAEAKRLDAENRKALENFGIYLREDN